MSVKVINFIAISDNFSETVEVPQPTIESAMAGARTDKRSKEFVRRIPDYEWAAITAKIVDLSPDFTDNELHALKTGEWGHAIFRSKNWPYLAFYAYLSGKIDQKHIDKLFIYDACRREGAYQLTKEGANVICCQLVRPNGTLDEKALEMAMPFLQEQFSKEQIPALLEHLKTLPPEDTQFFIIGQRPQKLLDGIYDASKFLLCDSQRVLLQMAAPPVLIHAMYQAKFGKHAMEPRSILGFSDIEVLSNPKKRISAIPCPFITHPEKVHNKRTTPLGIYHHDIAYHLLIESANPHKEAWIELAQAIKKHKEDCIKQFGEETYNCLFQETLDREFRMYPLKEDAFELTDGEKFWYSLISLSVNLKKHRVDFATPWLMERFMAHAAVNAQAWKDKYGIAAEDLSSLIKKLDVVAGFPKPLLAQLLSIQERLQSFLAILK